MQPWRNGAGNGARTGSGCWLSPVAEFQARSQSIGLLRAICASRDFYFFFDPPKPGIEADLAALDALDIRARRLLDAARLFHAMGVAPDGVEAAAGPRYNVPLFLRGAAPVPPPVPGAHADRQAQEPSS